MNLQVVTCFRRSSLSASESVCSGAAFPAAVNLLPRGTGSTGGPEAEALATKGKEDVVQLYLMSPRGGANQAVGTYLYTMGSPTHLPVLALSPSVYVFTTEQSLI